MTILMKNKGAPIYRETKLQNKFVITQNPRHMHGRVFNFSATPSGSLNTSRQSILNKSKGYDRTILSRLFQDDKSISSREDKINYEDQKEIDVKHDHRRPRGKDKDKRFSQVDQCVMDFQSLRIGSTARDSLG